MSLSRVEVTQEVLLACMAHAMTTEAEEIMGLLLGDALPDEQGEWVCRIWMAYPQIRTDRRKDRVETSPEQMARCSAHAERLSRETGLRTRVVGWYHSHPHITVHPSHVDVRTQAMYQMLDECFVGLIFSTFNHDVASKEGRVQVTAFQSVPAGAPAQAPSSIVLGGPNTPGTGMGGDPLKSALEPFSSAELAGLDSATKAAIRASVAADVTAPGSLVRRDVPLSVVRARSPTERSLHDFVTVQRILALEEREAYGRALAAADHVGGTTTGVLLRGTATPMATAEQGTPVGGVEGGAAVGNAQPSAPQASGPGSAPAGTVPSSLRALARLHHASAYQQGLAQMVEGVLAPALAGMRGAAWQAALHASQLKARNQELKRLLDVAQAATAAQQAAPQAAQKQVQHTSSMVGYGTPPGFGSSATSSPAAAPAVAAQVPNTSAQPPALSTGTLLTTHPPLEPITATYPSTQPGTYLSSQHSNRSATSSVATPPASDLLPAAWLPEGVHHASPHGHPITLSPSQTTGSSIVSGATTPPGAASPARTGGAQYTGLTSPAVTGQSPPVTATGLSQTSAKLLQATSPLDSLVVGLAGVALSQPPQPPHHQPPPQQPLVATAMHVGSAGATPVAAPSGQQGHGSAVSNATSQHPSGLLNQDII